MDSTPSDVYKNICSSRKQRGLSSLSASLKEAYHGLSFKLRLPQLQRLSICMGLYAFVLTLRTSIYIMSQMHYAEVLEMGRESIHRVVGANGHVIGELERLSG